MSAPSPGPWAIDRIGNTYVITSGDGPLTDIVCIVNILLNDLSNARLLRATPELLDGCEMAIDFIKRVGGDGSAELLLQLGSIVAEARKTIFN